MKYVLLFYFFVYVTANTDIHQLLSGSLIHLGPYDALVKIGKLSKSYNDMDDRDLLASRNAKHFIEDARKMFKGGGDGLPSLDPYFQPHLPVIDIDDIHITSGKLHLNNLNITGAKQFNTKFLEVRLKTDRVDVELNVPKINIEVDVSVEAVIAIILPVHFSGHLSVVLENVTILAAGQAAKEEHNGELHYQLIAQHARVHIDDVAVQITNIKMNDILKNQVLESSALSNHKAIENVKKTLNKHVASFVLQEINSILLGPTAKEVLAYLLPEVK